MKKPFVPMERGDTIRHDIIKFLKMGRSFTAREISGHVSISEKEVLNHLHHIEKTLHNEKEKLIMMPAECLVCGFVFKRRERFRKPSRCPECKSEHVEEPSFSIE